MQLLLHYSEHYNKIQGFNKWIKTLKDYFKVSFKQLMNSDVEILVEKSVDLKKFKSSNSNDLVVYIPILISSADISDFIKVIDKNILGIKDKTTTYLTLPLIDTQIEISIKQRLSVNSDIIQFNCKSILSEFIGEDDLLEFSSEGWLDILDLVYRIKLSNSVSKKDKTDDTVKIFLATVSPDILDVRAKIIRELNHYGIQILPLKALSGENEPFKKEVTENIKKSKLSVHLIGNEYLPILENSNVSSTEMQLDIFNEINANNKGALHQLIWFSPAFKAKSDRQKKFAGQIANDVAENSRTEIVQCPLEVFKSIIIRKVKELSVESKEVVEVEKGTTYLIHSGFIDNNIELIRKELIKRKAHVVELKPNDNSSQHLHEHKLHLFNCDNVIVYYNFENEQWINSKIKDILKAPGFGRIAPFKTKSLIIEKSLKKSVSEINTGMDHYEYSKNIKISDIELLIQKI